MTFRPRLHLVPFGLTLLVGLFCLVPCVCADETDRVREERNQLLRQFRTANSATSRRAILDKLMALRLKDRPKFGIYQCVDEGGAVLDGSGQLSEEMLAFLKNCAYRPETRSQTLDRFLSSYGMHLIFEDAFPGTFHLRIDIPMEMHFVMCNWFE